jgi:hypothetical protein
MCCGMARNRRSASKLLRSRTAPVFENSEGSIEFGKPQRVGFKGNPLLPAFELHFLILPDTQVPARIFLNLRGR